MMSNSIQYIKGDATQPQSEGNQIIVHICNDIGGWGKGFVMAISKRWPEPEKKYREWFSSKEEFALGEVQLVQVTPSIWVANVIGQHKINRDEEGKPPIRYEAVHKGLEKVGEMALEHKASVHMPRIGCGLAGGTWERIEPLIESTLLSKNVAVTVYDFEA